MKRPDRAKSHGPCRVHCGRAIPGRAARRGGPGAMARPARPGGRRAAVGGCGVVGRTSWEPRRGRLRQGDPRRQAVGAGRDLVHPRDAGGQPHLGRGRDLGGVSSRSPTSRGRTPGKYKVVDHRRRRGRPHCRGRPGPRPARPEEEGQGRPAAHPGEVQHRFHALGRGEGERLDVVRLPADEQVTPGEGAPDQKKVLEATCSTMPSPRDRGRRHGPSPSPASSSRRVSIYLFMS